MTDAQEPVADAHPPDMEQILRDFKTRSEASVAKIEAIGAQIAELATAPGPVAVQATMDSDGIVTSMTIDSGQARSLDAEALGRDVGLALAEAARNRPAKEPEESRREAEDFQSQAEASGLDLEAMLASIFSGQAPKETEVEVVEWNALRTVGIAVRWGAVRSVAIDERWLSSTSLHAVADEVRDAVNIIIARGLKHRGGN